ncbi:MAG: SDR family NAD(P)-dependent oxidoreductase [Gammaproteobacteria bacterium]|nr:SDR family NAD(P)-dependent oxidoreductase [Gammaproteobacteria bacterium]
MQASGQRILITGGAKGIGLALTRKFVAAGNTVIIVGRDRAALTTAAAGLPAVEIIEADVATEAGRNDVIQKAGDVSVLVNNAGVQFNGDFARISPASIDSEVGVNLLAPLHLTHALLPRLLEKDEAAVMNVTSILGIVPKQSAAVYCATKAALHSFTKTLRWQLEQSNVRVMEVVPPVVDTAMTAGRGQGKLAPQAVADAVWQGYLADTPTIRVGKAGVAAALARWAPSVAERIIRRGD